MRGGKEPPGGESPETAGSRVVRESGALERKGRNQPSESSRHDRGTREGVQDGGEQRGEDMPGQLGGGPRRTDDGGDAPLQEEREEEGEVEE